MKNTLRILLCSLIVCFLPSCKQDEHQVIIFNTLGGALNSATSIDENNTVVGFSYTKQNKTKHAFVAFGRKIIDIGTLGGKYCEALSIGPRKHVVGVAATDRDRALHAFLWTPTDGMRDLGTLGGPYQSSEARSVNGKGQVVGSSENLHVTDRAFLWTAAEGMRDLGTLGGKVSVANAINEKGQVVGFAQNAEGIDRAYLWTPAEGMRDLGTLGGKTSVATAINEKGQVVGFAQNAEGIDRAFLWTSAEGMSDLGGVGACKAMDINNRGDIVGISNIRGISYDATLWVNRNGKIQIYKPANIVFISAINDSGYFVGRCVWKGNNDRACMAPPGVYSNVGKIK